MTRRVLYGFIIIILGIVSSLLVIDHSATTQHEAVHRQIHKYYGCKNITVEVNWFKNSFTRCEDQDYKQPIEATTMHSYNEVISYNNDALLFVVGTSTLFVVAAIFLHAIYTDK